METKLKPQMGGGLIFIIPNKFIVLTEGMAIGTFNTPEQALAWAYEHSRDGIYTIKELINPQMEI